MAPLLDKALHAGFQPEEQIPAPDLLEDLKAKNDASDKLVDDILHLIVSY